MWDGPNFWSLTFALYMSLSMPQHLIHLKAEFLDWPILFKVNIKGGAFCFWLPLQQQFVNWHAICMLHTNASWNLRFPWRFSENILHAVFLTYFRPWFSDNCCVISIFYSNIWNSNYWLLREHVNSLSNNLRNCVKIPF